MSAIERWLQQQWYRSGPAQLALLPLSWLFGFLASMRRLAYRMGLLRSYKLPVPVIVVGNISIGGTGKTPFVLWLAENLQHLGYRPGIISRGYGGKTHEVQSVSMDSAPALVGDEPAAGCIPSDCDLVLSVPPGVAATDREGHHHAAS